MVLVLFLAPAPGSMPGLVRILWMFAGWLLFQQRSQELTFVEHYLCARLCSVCFLSPGFFQFS